MGKALSEAVLLWTVARPEKLEGWSNERGEFEVCRLRLGKLGDDAASVSYLAGQTTANKRLRLPDSDARLSQGRYQMTAACAFGPLIACITMLCSLLFDVPCCVR